MNIEPVFLAKSDTKLGGVESWEDARKCAAPFKENKDRIDCILAARRFWRALRQEYIQILQRQ